MYVYLYDTLHAKAIFIKNGKQRLTKEKIMEYKIIPCQIAECKSNDEEYFTFSGYASTFYNEDRGGDIVCKGAFCDSIKNLKAEGKMLPILFSHKTDMPLGTYTHIKEDDRGLLVTGRMPKDDEFVKGRVIPQIKAGSLNSMSIGYNILEKSYDGRVRNLEKLDVMEISIVTLPMNVEAEILAFKSIEEVKTLADIEKVLHDKGFSNKQSKVIISKINSIKEQISLDRKDAEAREELQEELTNKWNSIIDTIDNLKV